MAEASFLIKQKARIDALQRHQKPDQSHLSSIRDEIRNIQSRLDETNLDPAEIPALRLDLQNLRRRCTDELHVSDVRWMHRELSLCQEKLTLINKAHKPKFAFRRYRAAMMKQRNEGETVPNEENTPAFEETPGPVKPKPEPSQDDRKITGYSSANVRIGADGTICVDDIPQNQIVSTNAIVLDDICACEIHLKGTYTSVHLRNIQESAIHCHAQITSLHVTSCQHVQLQISTVQQIRLHDSTHVQCNVNRCTAGIILEACHHMQFMVSDETVEIHDFQWLHVNQPSPNFTVEYQPRRIAPPTAKPPELLSNQRNEAPSIGKTVVNSDKNHNDDESGDDEL